MPWTISDVDRHNKGLSKSQKKKWVKTANAILAKDGDEGKAIRIANSRVQERAEQRASDGLSENHPTLGGVLKHKDPNAFEREGFTVPPIEVREKIVKFYRMFRGYDPFQIGTALKKLQNTKSDFEFWTKSEIALSWAKGENGLENVDLDQLKQEVEDLSKTQKTLAEKVSIRCDEILPAVAGAVVGRLAAGAAARAGASMAAQGAARVGGALVGHRLAQNLLGEEENTNESLSKKILHLLGERSSSDPNFHLITKASRMSERDWEKVIPVPMGTMLRDAVVRDFTMFLEQSDVFRDFWTAWAEFLEVQQNKNINIPWLDAALRRLDQHFKKHPSHMKTPSNTTPAWGTT